MSECNGGFDWWQAVSIAVGAFLAVFAARMEAFLFRRRLEFSFDHDRCVKETPTEQRTSVRDEHGQEHVLVEASVGRYVRVELCVRGWRTVVGCRCHLVEVEKHDGVVFQPTTFADSLRLKWSSRLDDEVLGAIDIPRGVSQFIDVVSTDRSAPSEFAMQMAPIPFYCHELFDRAPKSLRFTIVATADGVKPTKTRLIFDWRGAWNDFSVRPE